MSRTVQAWGAAALIAILAAGVGTSAQTPTPAGQQGRAARAGAGRAALPPLSQNMNQQQLQAYMDAYALVQAERELALTGEQYPNFVARLRKLQDVRRRQQAERRRLLVELGGLLQGNEAGRDDAIVARVAALDDVAQKSGVELRKAYQDLDAVLTPWQRGRFRTFEEQLERRKIELLAKISGGGQPSLAPAGGPGRGR